MMVWLARAVLICALMCETCLCAHGQDQAPQGEIEVVSGTIADLPPGRIVVSRAVLGKSENRSFLLTGETKVEGRLRVGARVTVGFRASPEGDVALRVIVRSGAAATRQTSL